jgi:hypothetical protein
MVNFLFVLFVRSGGSFENVLEKSCRAAPARKA